MCNNFGQQKLRWALPALPPFWVKMMSEDGFVYHFKRTQNEMAYHAVGRTCCFVFRKKNGVSLINQKC